MINSGRREGEERTLREGPRRKGPRRVGPRRVGPRSGSPQGGAPKGGLPKISRFFFFSFPAPIFFHSSLFWCLKRRGPEMFTFGVLGLSCEAPAAVKTRQPESPNVNISGPRPSKTPKFHEKIPKRGKKE